MLVLKTAWSTAKHASQHSDGCLSSKAHFHLYLASFAGSPSQPRRKQRGSSPIKEHETMSFRKDGMQHTKVKTSSTPNEQRSLSKIPSSTWLSLPYSFRQSPSSAFTPSSPPLSEILGKHFRSKKKNPNKSLNLHQIRLLEG